MTFTSKKFSAQRLVLKIHTDRLRRAKWKLTLPLAEARKNDELIALSDSTILRFIDELNGVTDMDERALDIRKKIRAIRKLDDCTVNRAKIRRLYEALDEVQYKPDYLCLVIDKNKDYWRACKGFYVNDIKYVRLLGTNGGVKMSTIVFVSERLAGELRRRIENGRDMTVPLVPAKLEAYKALVCSGSHPVSMPKGIAVVDDCITHFTEDVINVTDEGDGEPIMEFEAGA